MANHLRLSAFANSAANLSGLEWQVFSTQLEEHESFEDLFNPTFWKHHASGTHALRELDKVRILAADKSFDVEVTIDELVPGGAKIRLLNGMLPLKYHGMHSSEIRDILTKNEAEFEVVKLNQDGKSIPRVEQLPTGWRVIGNENEVIEHSIKAKSAADSRLDRYLRELSLRMPTPAEAHAHAEGIRARELEQARATAKKAPTTGRHPLKSEAA